MKKFKEIIIQQKGVNSSTYKKIKYIITPLDLSEKITEYFHFIYIYTPFKYNIYIFNTEIIMEDFIEYTKKGSFINYPDGKNTAFYDILNPNITFTDYIAHLFSVKNIKDIKYIGYTGICKKCHECNGINNYKYYCDHAILNRQKQLPVCFYRIRKNITDEPTYIIDNKIESIYKKINNIALNKTIAQSIFKHIKNNKQENQISFTKYNSYESYPNTLKDIIKVINFYKKHKEQILNDYQIFTEPEKKERQIRKEAKKTCNICPLKNNCFVNKTKCYLTQIKYPFSDKPTDIIKNLSDVLNDENITNVNRIPKNNTWIVFYSKEDRINTIQKYIDLGLNKEIINSINLKGDKYNTNWLINNINFEKDTIEIVRQSFSARKRYENKKIITPADINMLDTFQHPNQPDHYNQIIKQYLKYNPINLILFFFIKNIGGSFNKISYRTYMSIIIHHVFFTITTDKYNENKLTLSVHIVEYNDYLKKYESDTINFLFIKENNTLILTKISPEDTYTQPLFNTTIIYGITHNYLDIF